MKVLVCGDRHWTDYGAVKRALTELVADHGQIHVIEGGASGADAMAGHVAHDLRLHCEEVPADWATFGRAAGPIRNRQMLDLKPDLVLAFHNDIDRSRGTKDCVTEARRRGIPVEIHATHTPSPP